MVQQKQGKSDLNTLQYEELEEVLASESSAAPLLAGQEQQTASPGGALTYLLDLTGTEEKLHQFLAKARTRFISAFVLWQVLFLLSCAIATQIPAISLLPFVIFALGALGLTVPAFWWHLGHRVHCLRRQIKATLMLTEGNEARILGPLLDTLAITPYHYRAGLLPTITEYLWEVHPEDSYLLLNGHRRAILRREVRKLNIEQLPPHLEEGEIDFCIAAMKALAFSGDTKAIPILRYRARKRGDTINACVVQDAARECLNLLDTEATRRAVARRTLRELFGAKRETPATLILQDSYLKSLGSERAKLALVELLQEEGRKREGIKAFGIVVRVLPLPFIFMVPKANGNPLTFFLFLASLVSAWFFDALFVPDTIAIEATTRLCRYADKQTIGTLLDALQYDYLKSTLTPLVANLLMQFTESDSHLLTTKQCEYLRRTLQLSYYANRHSRPAPRFHASFLVAAIHALTVIGDKEVRPILEKAIREHPLTPVREAAERALIEMRS